MTSTERAIGAAWAKLLSSIGDGSGPSNRVLLQREPTSETWVRQHATWRPAGYYRLFCVHDRALWETCASATCRRDAREAKKNLTKLVSGTLL